MEGAAEKGQSSNYPFRVNGISRDLMNMNNSPNENEQHVTGDEVELSLGLSLNGRFGTDPSRKTLRRSSSISNLPAQVGEASSSRQARGDHAPPLVRSSSLPAEMEEWRRKKLLQSKRCMVARKKRMEKLKNGSGENVQSGIIMRSRRSIGSQSSSGGSSGINQTGAQQEANMLNPENDIFKNAMLDMPFVSTKGNGLDRKKTEGFLYRFKKGEDIKIVCVCHGLFLSPAEFVQHGGGGDVENPLKHISVHPFII